VSLRSDELLARLVASGGERPFRALYERYHAALYRYCHSILRNEADAQDALQSTFTRALVALREGKRNAPLRPWLYRIAHNESISMLRARRTVVPEADREPVGAEPSAEECADNRARLELLVADLAQLSERARAALVMREMSGLSHEEVAAALQISVGAAKQAIFEARRALFELAEGRAMTCHEVNRMLSDGDRRVLRGRQVRAHLRGCASCSAFAASMPTRQAQLRVLSPALPPAAAAAVFTRALEGAGANGGHAAVGASAASSGSTLAGAGSVSAGASSSVASAAKVLAVILTPKALLATAVIAGAAAGAGGLVTGLPAHQAAPVVKHHATSALAPVPGARAGHTGVARNSVALAHRSSSPAQTRAGQNSPGSSAAQAHGPAAESPGVAPGNNDPTDTGAAPGNGANAPGPSGTAPGNSGTAPGNSGTAPGNSGTAPGANGTAPGKSGTSPGKSGTAPGRSGTTSGHSGSAIGQGGNSPGNSAMSTSRTGTSSGRARHDHTPPGRTENLKSPHQSLG
jgi:RNA polymerase sigma factor (sigma-70 family)